MSPDINSFSLNRVSPAQTPLGTKPADQDQVIDLTQTQNASQELQTTNAEFLRVKSAGQDIMLSLKNLTPDQKKELLDQLKSNILNSNNQPKAGFSAETFFSMTGDRLDFGANTTTASFGGSIESATQVVTNSNAKTDDAIWNFMNAGESSLTPEGASQHVGKDDKPAAWYNGFTMSGGQINTHRSEEDKKLRPNTPTPKLTIDQYKHMLIQDFNFNGAIDKFKALGGESAFVQAMQAKYPNHPLGADGLNILAGNIYSYATTGADKQGKTDIAQMQGMLFALDPEICKTSDSNTAMQDGKNGRSLKTFSIPGIPTPICQGDGFHGRATILTTRHLLANMTTSTTEAGSLKMLPDSPFNLFGKNDLFIRDGSGSMNGKWNSIRGQIDQNLQAQGILNPGESVESNMQTLFNQRNQKTNIQSGAVGTTSRNARVPGSTLTFGQMNDKMSDYSQALDQAFVTLCPNGTEAEAKQFAKLMGVKDDEFISVFPVVNGKYTMDSQKLMKAVDDVASSEATDQQREYGAGGESGLKGLITTLMFDPDLSQASIDAKKPDKLTLNVLMDEPEQGLEYLELAKALAAKKGVDVRLVVVPTEVADTELTTHPERSIGLINLQDLSISPDRTSATYTISMLGQAPQTQTTPIYKSETNRPLREGIQPDTFKDLCLPFLFENGDREKPRQLRQAIIN